MKTSLWLIAVLALLITVSGCKSSSNAPAWYLLGQREVDFRGDHDVIRVTAEKGAFTAVRFRVKRSPIFLVNVKLTYGNGDSQNFPIGKRIQPGTDSKVFDLPGEARVINSITFNYKTAQRPGPQPKAMVMVFGRK